MTNKSKKSHQRKNRTKKSKRGGDIFGSTNLFGSSEKPVVEESKPEDYSMKLPEEPASVPPVAAEPPIPEVPEEPKSEEKPKEEEEKPWYRRWFGGKKNAKSQKKRRSNSKRRSAKKH